MTAAAIWMMPIHPLSAQTATPTPSDSGELSEMVVTGEEAPSAYTVTEATTALKADVPLLETPQAISVVPRQVIADQSARTLDDVIKNVAGVSPGGYYPQWDYYRIRGFDAAFTTFLDGLITAGEAGEEPWGMERVEVVKGPASSLYGQGPLGGFVNIVSKHPKPEFFGETQLTIGDNGLYEGAIDINSPLNKSATVYGRLNALYSRTDSFTDFLNTRRLYVAPSLTWEITPDTKLTILTSFKYDWMDHWAMSLPARGTVLYNPNGEIPINRYIGNPHHEGDYYEDTFRLGYQFTHKFNENLTLRNNFRYSRTDFESKQDSYNVYLSDDETSVGIYGYDGDGLYENLRVDLGLDAKFETGPIEHLITGGVDYRWNDTTYHWRESENTILVDLYHPDYDSLPAYVYGEPGSQMYQDTDLGFYVQEHAKWKNVTLTAGGRYDISKYDGDTGDADKSAFTPKVGLTWEFVPGFAAYANYSRSFNPQWFYADAAGQPVAPEKGENWETGLKFSLLEGKWTGLLSVYQLTRQNVATDNPATPDPFDSTVSGEQRSRGFEFESAAELLPGLEFTVAYTYIDARITEDNTIPVGSRLVGVPKHAVNAWLKYTLQDGPLKGLGAGLGGRYYTKQAGDDANTFDLPAYGVVDAAIYYERDKFHAQINFNNILDRRYFVGAYDDLYVLPGDPFSIRATVGWKF